MHVTEVRQAGSCFTPIQKIAGRPRVPVADVDGRKFEETTRGPLPCPGDQRQQLRRPVFLMMAKSRFMDHLGLIALLNFLRTGDEFFNFLQRLRFRLDVTDLQADFSTVSGV